MNKKISINFSEIRKENNKEVLNFNFLTTSKFPIVDRNTFILFKIFTLLISIFNFFRKMYNFLTSTSQVFRLLKIQISEIRWIRHLLSFFIKISNVFVNF